MSPYSGEIIGACGSISFAQSAPHMPQHLAIEEGIVLLNTAVTQLTSEQADRLSAFGEILAVIISHSELDLPLRRRMLISQLAVGYEFINYYRREQDRHWKGNRHTEVFNRFCELVVTHYRESRETQFYAEKMHLTPKYFSRVIRTATGGTSPAEWIEQYVITQAKRLIETNRAHSVKEIAYMLRFTESTSFYCYFHCATGLTAKQYRDRVVNL